MSQRLPQSDFRLKPGFVEESQTEIQNIICLTCTLATIVFAVIGRDSLPYVLNMIVLLAIFITGMVMNYMEKSSASAYFIVIATTAWITETSIIFGANMGVQHYLVITLVVASIYIPKGYRRLFSISLIIAVIVATTVYQKHQSGIYAHPAAVELIYNANIFIPYLIVCLICVSVVRQALAYQSVMEQQKQAFLEGLQFKDKIFSIIGHDMRVPFINTKNILNLIELDEIREDEKTVFYQQINSSIDVSLRTLDNLLVWGSKKDLALDNAVDRQTLDLNAIVYQVIDFYQQTAQSKEILLLNLLPSPTLVLADADQLAFVIRNLTSNAIKFSHIGQTVTFEVADFDQHFLRICVKDQGVGMSKETRDGLFNISQRFSNTGTCGECGTGLGLIFCRDFIRSHGGDMWIESEPGNGTCIYFTLRLAS